MAVPDDDHKEGWRSAVLTTCVDDFVVSSIDAVPEDVMPGSSELEVIVELSAVVGTNSVVVSAVAVEIEAQ